MADKNGIMNVKQLKQKLEQYPDYMEVYLDERVTEFAYGLLNSVGVRDINYMEDPYGEVLAEDKALILSEL